MEGGSSCRLSPRSHVHPAVLLPPWYHLARSQVAAFADGAGTGSERGVNGMVFAAARAQSTSTGSATGGAPRPETATAHGTGSPCRHEHHAKCGPRHRPLT